MQMSHHSERDAGEQGPPTAAAASPVSDNTSTSGGAEISSHEIDAPLEAECRPNVHMQRLGAIGNFLIFRWDRLGPRDRRREGPSAGIRDGATGGGLGEPRAAASRRAGGEAVPVEAPPPPAFHPAGAVAVGAHRVASVMSDVCLSLVSALMGRTPCALKPSICVCIPAWPKCAFGEAPASPTCGRTLPRRAAQALPEVAAHSSSRVEHRCGHAR